jgi:hypothetical protein
MRKIRKDSGEQTVCGYTVRRRMSASVVKLFFFVKTVCAKEVRYGSMHALAAAEIRREQAARTIGELQSEGIELATAVARGLPCPNLPATTQGALPAVPPGASLKEEGTVPPMPPVTFVKEEGVVPPMPPDAFVKAEVVVKEEEGSDSRPKRQRAK